MEKEIIPLLFVIENINVDYSTTKDINSFMKDYLSFLSKCFDSKHTLFDIEVGVLLIDDEIRWQKEEKYLQLKEYQYEDIVPHTSSLCVKSLLDISDELEIKDAFKKGFVIYLSSHDEDTNMLYKKALDKINKADVINFNRNVEDVYVPFTIKKSFNYYEISGHSLFFKLTSSLVDKYNIYKKDNLHSLDIGRIKARFEDLHDLESAPPIPNSAPPTTSAGVHPFRPSFYIPQKTKEVEYSLISEKVFKKNENFIIDFLMYEKHFKKLMKSILKQYNDPKVSEGNKLRIKEGTHVTVILSSPNLFSIHDEVTFIYEKRYHIAKLSGFIPNDYEMNNITLSVDILIEGLRISNIKTLVNIGNDYHFNELVLGRNDAKRIFFSYSSEDRDTVIELVDRIRTGFGDSIEFFLDVLSLRAGEKWEKALYKEIKACDTFCLVWSKHAKESSWVEKEWKYALSHKGIKAFAPISLLKDTAKEAPIPEELQDVHFANYFLLRNN